MSTGIAPPLSACAPYRALPIAAIAELSGFKLATLRTEIRNGNLAVSVIAGKHYTSLQAIQEMVQKCRVAAKAPISGSAPSKSEPDELPPPPGSSATADHSTALAAVLETARRLRENSANTSPPNMPRRGENAVLIKFPSRT
jgi:hypothetical protein